MMDRIMQALLIVGLSILIVTGIQAGTREYEAQQACLQMEKTSMAAGWGPATGESVCGAILGR